MEWVIVATGVAVALVAVDRAMARWSGRPGRAPRAGWRTTARARHPGAGSGMLGDLIELFQPNHQHLVAEQERQRTEVRESGSAAPPFDIDLEAGVAVLHVADKLPARRQVARRHPSRPSLGSTTMTVRSELFVADHTGALARVEARDAGREPKPGAAALELPGVGAIDLELLGEIAARGVQFGTGPLELEEVDLDHESLLELPSFLREVLVELGTAEDPELPAEVAAEWATDEDLGLTPTTALTLVTAIVELLTGAVESGRSVYLWTAAV